MKLLVFVLSLAILPSLLPAQTVQREIPASYVANHWRPDRFEVLLNAQGSEYTEADVALWLIHMGGNPLLLQRSEAAIQPILESIVEAQIARAAFSRGRSSEATIMARNAQVYRTAFADLLVDRTYDVEAEPVAYAYKTMKDEYPLPEKRVVRVLRVRPVDPDNPVQVEEALARARELRRAAVVEGGLKSIDAENLTTVSPSLTIIEDQSFLPGVMEPIVFDLLPGQISPVFAESDSAVCVEIVERVESDPPTIDVVKDDIEMQVRPVGLASAAYQALRFAREDDYFINRGRAINHLDDEQVIARTLEFSMTKAELIEAYPYLVVVEEVRRPDLAQEQIAVVLEGVVALDKIGERGDLFRTVYGSVERMTRLALSIEQANRTFLESMEPADIARRAVPYREQFAPSKLLNVYVLRRTPGVSGAKRVQAPEIAKVAEEMTRLLRERADLVGNNAYAFPTDVSSRVLRSMGLADELEFVAINDASAVQLIETLGIEETDIPEVGSFSQTIIGEGGPFTVYCASVVQKNYSTHESYRLSREFLASRGYTIVATPKREQLEAEGKITYFPN